MDWNLQNITVLGTAATLGNLGVKVGERLVDSFQSPSSPALPATPPVQVVDPLSWLPPGLLTANAPRVPLELPALGRSLAYLGHVPYYQPTQRVLLWRVEPGKLLALRRSADVAFIAEQIPCDSFGQQLMQPLAAGRELQTLG